MNPTVFREYDIRGLADGSSMREAILLAAKLARWKKEGGKT